MNGTAQENAKWSPDMEFGTVSIRELDGQSFFIPSYQRGYRWKKQQVEDLLNDIWEFKKSVAGNPGGSAQATNYYIQLLLVKKNQDQSFEVVDGQQRLTTIYLLLSVFATLYNEQLRLTAQQDSFGDLLPPQYLELWKPVIQYHTREGTSDFLRALLRSDNNLRALIESASSDTIDIDHIKNACKTAIKWVGQICGTDPSRPVPATVLHDMYYTLMDKTFFLWYAIPENADPIAEFSRINNGNIRLTNSELIKALFLGASNFSGGAGSSEVNMRLAEISSRWDEIEQTLRDDSFWAFLTGSSKISDTSTRIDLLFQLLAERLVKDTAGADAEARTEEFPFTVLYKALNKRSQTAEKQKFLEGQWSEIKRMYSQFRDWYQDVDKYHKVGYLTAVGCPLHRIWSIITDDKPKSEIDRELLQEIKTATFGFALDPKASKSPRVSEQIDQALDRIKAAKADNSAAGADLKAAQEALKDVILDCLNDDQLSYESSLGKKHILSILLLFNIATLITSSDRQYRFPFDTFRKEKWDMEHIHAKNDAGSDGSIQVDDSISNLALLDQSTNREYKDSPFPIKRRIILHRESHGRFIPPCTINVFTKVYTDLAHDPQDQTAPTSQAGQDEIWGEEDKKAYINNIAETLALFFKGEKRKLEDAKKDGDK